jgi:hypothetical protein
MNLFSKKERIIFDGQLPPFEGQPSSPELSPENSNLLAVTLRGKHDGVFLADLLKKTMIFFAMGACQINW